MSHDSKRNVENNLKHTHKEKKESKKKKLIKLIIFLLIVHIILVLSTCTTIKQKEVQKSIPINVLKEKEVSLDQCFSDNYQWRHVWGDFDQEGKLVTTTFTLTNLEDQSGNFAIDFAFFDGEKYSFEKYRGIDYDLVRNELPWNSASMYSQTYKIFLNAKQSRSMAVSVPKANPNGTYWVYADVQTDKIEKCIPQKKIIYVNVTEEKNITEIISVEERKTWWEIVLEKIFGDNQK